MVDTYEVDEDGGNPDPDENTYTERALQACGHWQTWEQFKGLPMTHDANDLCWECEIKQSTDTDFTDPFDDALPCPCCGERWDACACPWCSPPWPSAEEEQARMTEAERERDEAWAEQEAESATERLREG